MDVRNLEGVWREGQVASGGPGTTPVSPEVIAEARTERWAALRIAPDLELVIAKPEHAGPLLDLIQRNRDHIGRYLRKVTEIDSSAKADAHLAHCVERCQARELFEFHVFQLGQLCGIVRLNYFEWESRKAAIAYLLDEARSGQGIITRAAGAVLEFGFRHLNLNRIELRCAVSNAASKRVAERLGFTLEGTLREAEWLDGRPEDEFIYGLLRDEFRR